MRRRNWLFLLGLAVTAAMTACNDDGTSTDASAADQLLTQGSVTATLKIDNDWGGGYCATVTLANGGTTAVSAWTAVLNTNGSTVSSLWSGAYTVSGSTVTVKPAGYNGSIAASGSVSFGFCANGSTKATLTSIAITGGSNTGVGGAAGAGGSTAKGGTTAKGGSSAGGTTAKGGSSAGGTTAKGGSAATGGVATGGSTSTVIPTAIPTATSTETRASTTVLPAGVHDMGNKRIGVKSTASCDGEGQPAVFELADGATLKNVIIAGGTPGGNGVVCKGNCTLENVYWEDVCEDAATNSKDGATMTVNKAIALNASDKVFQHNAKGGAKTVITNSYIATFGKVWRSCGDCTNNGGPRHLVLNNVKVEGVGSCVAGANENYGDTVTITNLFVKGGYSASSDKPKICQVFKGVEKGNGSSTKLYDGASQWNTSTCKVSQSDVKAY
jgi:hypothetical protein